MSLLFITKLKIWMFLSYECHSLIQDNVFHIFTLTAPLNDTWECLFCSVCAFQLLTRYTMIKCSHIFTPCSFATAITYNTDNVSHQTSLNRSSGTIPVSSPYMWLHTVSMNPVTTSMSGLLSLKVLLKRHVGLGSTTLTRIYRRKPLQKIRENTLCRRRKWYLVKQRVKH